MIDWRWRKLFCVILLCTNNDYRAAKYQTARLLRARTRIDKKH